jgi:hypothetical protein
VGIASERGLKALAIADHDSVDGVSQAITAGEFYGVEVIPAVELMYERGPCEAHIIGYFIDWRNKTLLKEIDRAKLKRAERFRKTIEKLQKLGVDITYGDVSGRAGRAAILGRTHIAQTLAEMGMVKTPAEAFSTYLGYKKAAYVSARRYSLKAVLRPIFEAGGVAAVAHPKFSGAEELIPELVEHGVCAIEVYHPFHTAREIKHFKSVARKYHLIEVGGTDSEREKSPVGTIIVPYKKVEELKKVWKKQARA